MRGSDVYSASESHWPVLHAEGIHIDDAGLAVPQDVVELHVESAGLLRERTALRLHVLQLVRQSLHAVLHLLHLERSSKENAIFQSAQSFVC